MRQQVPARWGSSRRVGRRPRVLIEDDDRVLAVSDLHQFGDAGFDVAVCSGPGVSRSECPLLSGTACPLVDGADVVLHRLDPALGIEEVVRRSRPDIAVVATVHRCGRTVAPDGAGTTQLRPLDSTSSLSAQLRTLRSALTARPRRPNPS